MPEVRPAAITDLRVVQEIYAHWVESGLSSFEVTAPDLGQMRTRWEDVVVAGLPYLVAETEDGVRGFAYASRYNERPGYRNTVENSVYIHPDARRQGLGLALLEALIEQCRSLGLMQMVAIIGDSGNSASINLHRSCGFEHVGILRDVGWKFDRLVDTVIMQRDLRA